MDPTLVRPLRPGATLSPSCDRPTLSVHPHPKIIDQVLSISARPPSLRTARVQVGARKFTFQLGNQRVSILPLSTTEICPSLSSSTASDLHIRDSSPFVYSIAELLRLSASPLVGISKESQIALDDLVAHHVWRRGPQSGTLRAGRRRESRDVSRPRSLHTSTDESGHSD